MRRADRLFRIVQMLRAGRSLTGARIAARLEVSLRTLYRDIADLQASGVPIQGEAGVGYTLRRDMDMPPMQFTADEVAALVLGARMVQSWGGTQMSAAAREALGKMNGVLSAPLRAHMDAVQMYVPPHSLPPHTRQGLDAMHHACVQRRILSFGYTRLDGAASARRVHPLALIFWGSVWTLAAWDPARKDFRVFRADRIADLQVDANCYEPKRGQTLADYLRSSLPEQEWKRIHALFR